MGEDDLSELDAEYLALAESLVTEALIGFDKLVSPAALDEIHSYFVDELLCTSYGRKILRSLKGPVVLESDEVVIDDGTLREIKKKGETA